MNLSFCIMNRENLFNLTQPIFPMQNGLPRLVEAFPFDTTPRYLERDRDSTYGQRFRTRVKSLGIEEVVTAPRSPWQNTDGFFGRDSLIPVEIISRYRNAYTRLQVWVSQRATLRY